MGIEIEFFASIREALGIAVYEIPASQVRQLRTVRDVREWVLATLPSAESSGIAEKGTRCAINDEFVGLAHAVQSGDRVAFMPAVTGG